MPRGSGPLTRALLVTLLLVAPLAACAPGGPDRGAGSSPGTTTAAPTVSRTSNSSPTPTPTPTVLPVLGPLPDGVAPARPAALDQPPTLDGAKAVATYFLLLFSYGYQTNDLAAAQALSTPECVFCNSFLDNVRAQSGRGQKMLGGSVQVLRLGGTEVTPGKFFNVQATIREAPSQTVNVQGAAVESLKEATTDVDMVVLYSNSGWTIRELSYKAAQ